MLRAVGIRLEIWLESERTQLPNWVPVALGVGICAWFALPTRGEWLAMICLSLGLAGIIATVTRMRGRLAGAISIGLLLMALGTVLVWARSEWVATQVLTRPTLVAVDGVVVIAEPLPARGIVRLTVHPSNSPELPDRIRVNLDNHMLPKSGVIRAGDSISARARLLPPAPPNFPGGYDFARRAWFDGIGATGRLLAPVVVRQGGGRPWLPDLRRRLADHVASRLPDATGAIAVTLATGDRGHISDAQGDAMRRAGLAHLLSISGLHVTAVIGVVIFITFRLLALSQRLALHVPLIVLSAGAGAVAGIGYTLLTGAEVPTIRSCIAALLVMAGMAIGREAISMRLLAVAALLVLLVWPEAVIGPSFQLSFAAVAAIVALHEHPAMRRWLARREEAWGRRTIRALAGLAVTGIAVELTLTPIVLYHFHQTGLLGVVANMVAIPLTEMVILPVEGLALLLDMVGAGAPAWWIVDKALALLLTLANWIAGRPGTVLLSPAVPDWAFSVTVLGILWCLIWRSGIRWLGLLGICAGLIGYALAPVPDIVVSADGHHVGIRTEDGAVALLRDRTGSYMREQIGEQMARDIPQDIPLSDAGLSLADMPFARCSPDFCTVKLHRGGRDWSILITRSRLSVPWSDLVSTCARADIVIADRRLPKACHARWLKMDAPDLRRRGGGALYLGDGLLQAPHVRRVRSIRDDHPWIKLQHWSLRRQTHAIANTAQGAKRLAPSIIAAQ